MRIVLMMLISCAANASNASCYTSENITTCGDQFTAIKFDNMTQIETPTGSLTIYNYNSGSTVIVPAETDPSGSYLDNPLRSPALDSLEFH